MTEYRVMVKGKHNKRYQCFGHHTDAYHADKHAASLSNDMWTKEVKIIVKDSNGVTNELKYK